MSRVNDASADELRTALDALIKLQAHYAKLLNLHDGGRRHAFTSTEEWLERLQQLDHPEEVSDGKPSRE